MTYGTPEWQGWVLGEEDGLKHIKAAFDAGINAFDTANVCVWSDISRTYFQLTSNDRYTLMVVPRKSLARRSKSTTFHEMRS
jgi:diketogulonate reductase-like aldo/keto reductase